MSDDQRPISACPCCGQSWPTGRSKDDAARLLKAVAWAGPVQSRIIECLLRNFGSWVSRAILIEVAFVDDPDGGPLNANNNVAVTMNRLRRTIEPFGLRLEGMSWRGTRLRWATESEPAPCS